MSIVGMRATASYTLWASQARVQTFASALSFSQMKKPLGSARGFVVEFPAAVLSAPVAAGTKVTPIRIRPNTPIGTPVRGCIHIPRAIDIRKNRPRVYVNVWVRGMRVDWAHSHTHNDCGMRLGWAYQGQDRGQPQKCENRVFHHRASLHPHSLETPSGRKSCAKSVAEGVYHFRGMPLKVLIMITNRVVGVEP